MPNSKISRNKKPIQCFSCCTLAADLLHLLSPTAFFFLFFFFSPVNGETLPRNCDLQLCPVGVLHVLYSSWPHLFCPPTPFLLLLLLSFTLSKLRQGMDLPPRHKDKPRQGISVQLQSRCEWQGAECVVSLSAFCSRRFVLYLIGSVF